MLHLFIPLSPWTPANYWCFHSLHRSAFSKMSYSWNQTDVTFSDWLLLLTIMHLGFLRVFLYLDNSFRVLFYEMMEIFYNWVVGMVAQFCECTKKHWPDTSEVWFLWILSLRYKINTHKWQKFKTTYTNIGENIKLKLLHVGESLKGVFFPNSKNKLEKASVLQEDKIHLQWHTSQQHTRRNKWQIQQLNECQILHWAKQALHKTTHWMATFLSSPGTGNFHLRPLKMKSPWGWRPRETFPEMMHCLLRKVLVHCQNSAKEHFKLEYVII